MSRRASGEPAHEHADVRFLLATRTPDAVVPEGPDAPLRWLSVADAEALTTEPNLLRDAGPGQAVAGRAQLSRYGEPHVGASHARLGTVELSVTP